MICARDFAVLNGAEMHPSTLLILSPASASAIFFLFARVEAVGSQWHDFCARDTGSTRFDVAGEMQERLPLRLIHAEKRRAYPTLA